MSTLTPSQRTLRAQIAAHSKWARTLDRSAATRPAREAFDKRFYDKVDPHRELDPATRGRLAASERNAYFKRLALKSSQARKAKAAS